MGKRTILITGCSSGIGRAAAERFHAAGWNVVATVRDPSCVPDLAREGLKLIAMELTDLGSIRAAVDAAIGCFGGIDVLVNNAGFSVFGFFEEASDELLREQIDTNLLGPIHMVRAILPHFRARRAGLIINVTSLAAIVGPPLNAYYAATKWGLEGLSESLAAELKPFGIRCKIVQPGSTATNIFSKWDSLDQPPIADYDTIRKRIVSAIAPRPDQATPPETVAEAILLAATDDSVRMRYPGNPDAAALLEMRDQIGSEAFLCAMAERFPT